MRSLLHLLDVYNNRRARKLHQRWLWRWDNRPCKCRDCKILRKFR